MTLQAFEDRYRDAVPPGMLRNRGTDELFDRFYEPVGNLTPPAIDDSGTPEYHDPGLLETFREAFC